MKVPTMPLLNEFSTDPERVAFCEICRYFAETSDGSGTSHLNWSGRIFSFEAGVQMRVIVRSDAGLPGPGSPYVAAEFKRWDAYRHGFFWGPCRPYPDHSKREHPIEVLSYLSAKILGRILETDNINCVADLFTNEGGV